MFRCHIQIYDYFLLIKKTLEYFLMVMERLKAYLDKKDISVYSLENSIKASRGSISKAIKNNKSIGSNVVENILNKHLDLNPTWLLTGRGNMLLNDVNNKNDADNVTLDDFDKNEIIDYLSNNLSEFKSCHNLKGLTQILFADQEISNVMNEIEALKKQVEDIVKQSN